MLLHSADGLVCFGSLCRKIRYAIRHNNIKIQVTFCHIGIICIRAEQINPDRKQHKMLCQFIPYLSLPIYQATSDEVMEEAVGHIFGSSLPVGRDTCHPHNSSTYRLLALQ